MSRRATAATAVTAERASREAAALSTWNLTAAERQTQRDGIRAGAMLRLRTAAASILETARILAAEGKPVAEAAYLMPDTDPETGEQLDARDVIRQAVDGARAGRRGTWQPADPERMAPADVMKLAAYARRCAERMARPPLTDAEGDDVEGAACLAILARTNLAGALPRWRALAAADVAEAADDIGLDVDMLRNRWRGFAYLEARAAIRARHARLTAEQAADFTAPAEGDAPTAEQAAAAAAERAGAAVTEALEDVALPTYFLAATAPGKAPVKAAERDALALTLTTLTRADLAAARGVDAEAVKKGAQRGRKALAARVDCPADVRRWNREAERRAVASVARPAGRPPVEDAMRADVATAAAVRLRWPDRMAPCQGGEDGAVPAWPAPVTDRPDHLAPLAPAPAPLTWQGGRRSRLAPLTPALLPAAATDRPAPAWPLALAPRAPLAPAYVARSVPADSGRNVHAKRLRDWHARTAAAGRVTEASRLAAYVAGWDASRAKTDRGRAAAASRALAAFLAEHARPVA